MIADETLTCWNTGAQSSQFLTYLRGIGIFSVICSKVVLVLLLPVKEFMLLPSCQVDGCAAIAMPLAISSLSNHFKTFPASECPRVSLFMHSLVNGLGIVEGRY